MTTPHLDDEALSAALDGEASAAEQAHLATCSLCQAQLDPLTAVARAVATPVTPPPSADVAAAIAAAAAAIEAGPGMTDEPSGGRMSHPPVGGTLDRPGARPVGRTGDGRGPAPAERPAAANRRFAVRLAAAAGGVAAAVLIVAGLAVVLRTSSHSHSTTASVAESAPKSARSSAGLSISSTTIASSPFAAAPGDLGEQSDAGAIGRLIRPQLQSGPPAAFAPSANSPLASAAQGAAIACLPAARAGAGVAEGTGVAIRYLAHLRWRGQPAEVVVFSRRGGFSGVVVRSADCSVLAVLPL